MQVKTTTIWSYLKYNLKCLGMDLLTIKEAAEKLGVLARRVNQLIDENKLIAKKIGSQYVIKENDLSKVTIYGNTADRQRKKLPRNNFEQSKGG